MLSDLLRRAESINLLVRERPPISSDADVLVASHRQNEDHLAEYARLSKALGISNPHIDADLKIERFKEFLRAKDWAVFSLATVIKYMDEKATIESAAKAGWHWRPLREKDDIENARFGRAARRWGHQDTEMSPASDHYHGPHTQRQQQWSNGRQQHEDVNVRVPSSGAPYDKLVPLHALRKVAAIESEYREPVSFFVCDYAPAPHIEHPDPFLMAVIDNERLAQGVGRFVIDFWDEPGFGIKQQVA